VNIRLQVLCASWNKTKVTSLLAEEQPLTAWEERRKAIGSNDATLFDYCNCSNQPADRDIIDCLRLNPKVNHRVHSIQPRHRFSHLISQPIFSRAMHFSRKLFVSFLDLTLWSKSRTHFKFVPHRLLSTGTFLIPALHCIKLCCMATGDAYIARKLVVAWQ
jgi:hypothetical protein